MLLFRSRSNISRFYASPGAFVARSYRTIGDSRLTEEAVIKEIFFSRLVFAAVFLAISVHSAL